MIVINKKERDQIFRLFQTNQKLRFNEIERHLGIRSNMVSYHLDKMLHLGVIKKEDGYYYLTDDYEQMIPLYSNSPFPVPVILVAVEHNNKLLLLKRKKRPYKDYWAMIGGKIQLEEDLKDASLRIIKQKANIDGSFISFNSIVQERVQSDDKIKHNFFLFFTKVKTDSDFVRSSEYGELKWFSKDELDKIKIVQSDLWLLKNKYDSKTNINKVLLREENEELTSFVID